MLIKGFTPVTTFVISELYLTSKKLIIMHNTTNCEALFEFLKPYHKIRNEHFFKVHTGVAVPNPDPDPERICVHLSAGSGSWC